MRTEAGAAPALRACVIIPVYNHPARIGQVTRAVRSLDIDCLLIDDGSDATCAALLQHLAAADASIELLRLPHNRGKGVAVCTGLRHAHRRGYSHALQVDADGQHDLDDLPRFLAQARLHPDAVICGARDYAAMPASRSRGRRFTDLWVRIHTLSSRIEDSMCGYRLYPLRRTETLLARSRVGARMDFDTDILVRLYWDGAAVINLPTAVVYDDDAPSHFDLWRDNVRITWMHTRLFFGMLPRLPKLLARRRSGH